MGQGHRRGFGGRVGDGEGGSGHHGDAKDDGGEFHGDLVVVRFGRFRQGFPGIQAACEAVGRLADGWLMS